MPIRLRNNPYRGVNAHLQSYLQAERGDWPNFHTAYLARIRDDLDVQLPVGYLAMNEKSLQISENFWLQDVNLPYVSRADILTLEDDSHEDSQPEFASQAAMDAHPATLTLPLATLSDEERYGQAVVIHEVSQGRIGRPVTRLEILSPSNMPGQNGYDQYSTKREQTLLAGIRVVEMNLLHEFRPSVAQIPSYRDHDPQSHPYMIIVFDPSPKFQDGRILVYACDVESTLPATPIPLIGTETLVFDFDAPYQYVFSSQRYVYAMIDYAELPLAFDTYSPADQERIRARMEAIRTESD